MIVLSELTRHQTMRVEKAGAVLFQLEGGSLPHERLEVSSRYHLLHVVRFQVKGWENDGGSN